MIRMIWVKWTAIAILRWRNEAMPCAVVINLSIIIVQVKDFLRVQHSSLLQEVVS